MAMDVKGGAAGIRSDINITPLVDVVLVLLIIFMVAVPLLQMGYAVQVPPKVTTATPQPDADQVIVRLDEAGHPFINKTPIAEADFQAALTRVLTGRQNKVVFFAADGELAYDKVAAFMDMVRNAGAQNLGIVFDDLRPAPVQTTR
jgi:biopolymer transport protein TolR